MAISYYFIPVVTALIGWITNVVAVKMLFYPRKPINILGIKLQGVIPKRQEEMAKSLASLFAQLLSKKQLARHVEGLPLEEEVETLLDEKLKSFVSGFKEKMPMLKMFLNDETSAKISGELKKEVVGALPELKKKFATKLGQGINVRALVEDNVRSFTALKLERLIMHVATKELKSIELLGGALGLIIGLAQVALMVFLG